MLYLIKYIPKPKKKKKSDSVRWFYFRGSHEIKMSGGAAVIGRLAWGGRSLSSHGGST